VLTLLFFHAAFFAKIAWAGTKGEDFPGTGKKKPPFKVSYYRFYISLRAAVEQYCPMVGIQDGAHLLGGWRKRRANQALAVA
jgi:ribosome modulation factor